MIAQSKKFFLNNSNETPILHKSTLIIAYICTILYSLVQIVELSLNCYVALCATKIVMQYFPYIRAYKQPWSILILLTKPYFTFLNKFVPNLYIGTIGYDFSLILSLELLRTLIKVCQEINLRLFGFC